MNVKGDLPPSEEKAGKNEEEKGRPLDEPKVVNSYNRFVNAENIFVSGAQEEGFSTVAREPLLELPYPERTPEFVTRARKQTILLLGGPYEEKLEVARQVARFLAEQPPALKGGAPPTSLKVRERGQHSNLPGLLLAIQREKSPAVLILADLHPQNVDYDLRRVRKEAESLHHLVIMTTEDSRDSWEAALQDGLQESWVELNREGLYHPDSLASELVRLLAQAIKANRLPKGAFEPAHQPRKSTIGGVGLEEIASRLGTPGSIAFFVDQLCGLEQGSQVDPGIVEKLIAAAVDLKLQIERWFAKMKPEERILAIGLNFFEGLRDDQCFAALEQWVKHIRSHRDPSQRAFDYVDVYNLKNYFGEFEDDSSAVRFASRSSRFRQGLFKTAWRGHRRQILGALPLLTRLVCESVEKDSNDWELYGSEEHRGQLRGAVCRTISELGRLSARAVERALVTLAGHQELEIQQVAALAMAMWRGGGTSAQLFEMLDRWLRSYGRQATAQGSSPHSENKTEDQPKVHVLETITLTVAWAAESDPPGQLKPELVELFKQLALEEHLLVRVRFSQALRYVMSLHLVQLRDERLLHHLLRHGPDLDLVLGSSLASAYQRSPEQVKETLERLKAESAKPRPDGPSRIALLSTVAYAYGSLDYKQGGPLTLAQGFQWFQQVLAREENPALRNTVLTAAAFQAIRDFQQVAPHMQELMAEVRGEERAQILSILMAIYLKQRQEQQGGTRIEERSLPVWLDVPRPPTDIENALVTWSQSPETPEAQRIALQASIAFAQGVEEEEARFIRKENQRREWARREDAARQAAREPASEPQPGWYTLTFVPWLATLFTGGGLRRQHRRIVSGLLSEALTHNARRKGTLDFVLQKWEGHEELDIRAIVRNLRNAIEWHPYAGWLAVSSGSLLLLFTLGFLRHLLGG